MSLRSFHIFLVVTALGLCAFFSVWSARRAWAIGETQYWVLSVCAGVFLLIGFLYLSWFINKGPGKEPEHETT